MEFNELNPDDLDSIFKAIKLNVDKKDNNLEIAIHQLLSKYKQYQIQENDKKLIHRFHLRVSELFEKCKSQNALDYICRIRDILNYDGQDLTYNLNKIYRKSELLLLEKNEEGNKLYIKKSIPSWKQNIQINKNLYQFYDQDFWKLYDIMILQKQYCSNLIIFHMTKQENIERLYNESLERNQKFTKSKHQSKMEINTLLDKAEQLKLMQISQPIQTSYKNKSIIMFRNPSPNQKAYTKYSYSISPKKTSIRNSKGYQSDIKTIFDTEKEDFLEQNDKTSRNKKKQVFKDDKQLSILNESFKQKPKILIYQENCSPQKVDKNQTLILPELKSPHIFEQKDIEPIQILKNFKKIIPEMQSYKKPSRDLNNYIGQQDNPIYKISSRTFQTIRGLVHQ